MRSGSLPRMVVGAKTPDTGSAGAPLRGAAAPTHPNAFDGSVPPRDRDRADGPHAERPVFSPHPKGGRGALPEGGRMPALPAGAALELTAQREQRRFAARTPDELHALRPAAVRGP